MDKDEQTKSTARRGVFQKSTATRSHSKTPVYPITRGASTMPKAQPVRMKRTGNFSAIPKAATAMETTVSRPRQHAPNESTLPNGSQNAKSARCGLPRSKRRQMDAKHSRNGEAKNRPTESRGFSPCAQSAAAHRKRRRTRQKRKNPRLRPPKRDRQRRKARMACRHLPFSAPIRCP